MPEVPPARTTATLAGPLCEGMACECAAKPSEVGAPERPGFKRFEVRIGPIENDLWVSVGANKLYKTREKATECFYVDLETGKRHPVTMRAHGKNGVAARFTIKEHGKLGAYNTYEFECGGPGLCDARTIREYRSSLKNVRRNLHDPCGSTKVRGIQWLTGVMPDQMHPNDIHLQLTLQVYNFEPKHPSGTAKCSRTTE